MKTRIPHHSTTAKRRAKNMPRKEKIIRTWDVDGWTYELAQRPSGKYVVYAVEEDGDGWRIESADTVKAALEAVRQPDVEVLALMTNEE